MSQGDSKYSFWVKTQVLVIGGKVFACLRDLPVSLLCAFRDKVLIEFMQAAGQVFPRFWLTYMYSLNVGYTTPVLLCHSEGKRATVPKKW